MEEVAVTVFQTAACEGTPDRLAEGGLLVVVSVDCRTV